MTDHDVPATADTSPDSLPRPRAPEALLREREILLDVREILQTAHLVQVNRHADRRHPHPTGVRRGRVPARMAATAVRCPRGRR